MNNHNGGHGFHRVVSVISSIKEHKLDNVYGHNVFVKYTDVSASFGSSIRKHSV